MVVGNGTDTSGTELTGELKTKAEALTNALGAVTTAKENFRGVIVVKKGEIVKGLSEVRAAEAILGETVVPDGPAANAINQLDQNVSRRREDSGPADQGALRTGNPVDNYLVERTQRRTEPLTDESAGGDGQSRAVRNPGEERHDETINNEPVSTAKFFADLGKGIWNWAKR